MRTRALVILSFIVIAAGIVPASAEESEVSRPLTPRERIRANERKAQLNPALRGRWNPKSQEPASTTALASDNLAQRVLDAFRTDPDLAELIVDLQVRSAEGRVTLAGTVPDAKQRRLISRKVAAIEGVKSVENRLETGTVRPGA